jgi:hypothetical protein
MLTFLCFKKVGFLNSGLSAGAGRASSKFYPEPEPHKNDAAPQHCTILYNRLGYCCKIKLYNNYEYSHTKYQSIFVGEKGKNIMQ